MYHKIIALFGILFLNSSCDNFSMDADDHQDFLDVVSLVESSWNTSKLLKEYKIDDTKGAGLSNKIFIDLTISRIKNNDAQNYNYSIKEIEHEIKKIIKNSGFSQKSIELNVLCPTCTKK